MQVGDIAPDERDIAGAELRYAFTHELLSAPFCKQHDFKLHVFVKWKHKLWIGYVATLRSHTVYDLAF